jgi:hypothetical protein
VNKLKSRERWRRGVGHLETSQCLVIGEVVLPLDGFGVYQELGGRGI